MHPSSVADAAWVFAASEPSKVPFYVAGGLLACWAVAIGVIGITRAGFASSTRAAGLVMGCGAHVTIARGAAVLAQTRTIHDGSDTATADLPAGEYVFYCAVDAHREDGMHGTLTVR